MNFSHHLPVFTFWVFVAVGPQLMAELPKIAVFSGPTATIQNNEPFLTNIKARKKYGLPPLKDEAGLSVSVDTLPPAADPAHPTAAERAALAEKLKAFQTVFDTH